MQTVDISELPVIKAVTFSLMQAVRARHGFRASSTVWNQVLQRKSKCLCTQHARSRRSTVRDTSLEQDVSALRSVYICQMQLSRQYAASGCPARLSWFCYRVKKQPSRDDAPSKGHQVVKDEPASQGSNADSTTSGSSSKGNSPQDATRVTDAAGRKGIHTLRSSTVLNTTISRGFFKMQSVKQAYNDKSGDFALADRHDPSRDTAAAAEAKNANSGVASGSTRKDASDTGHPSESAPTASQVRLSPQCLCQPHMRQIDSCSCQWLQQPSCSIHFEVSIALCIFSSLAGKTLHSTTLMCVKVFLQCCNLAYAFRVSDLAWQLD